MNKRNVDYYALAEMVQKMVDAKHDGNNNEAEKIRKELADTYNIRKLDRSTRMIEHSSSCGDYEHEKMEVYARGMMKMAEERYKKRDEAVRKIREKYGDDAVIYFAKDNDNKK